jgi:hypothetical protein
MEDLRQLMGETSSPKDVAQSLAYVSSLLLLSCDGLGPKERIWIRHQRGPQSMGSFQDRIAVV